MPSGIPSLASSTASLPQSYTDVSPPSPPLPPPTAEETENYRRLLSFYFRHRRIDEEPATDGDGTDTASSVGSESRRRGRRKKLSGLLHLRKKRGKKKKNAALASIPVAMELYDVSEGDEENDDDEEDDDATTATTMMAEAVEVVLPNSSGGGVPKILVTNGGTTHADAEVATEEEAEFARVALVDGVRKLLERMERQIALSNGENYGVAERRRGQTKTKTPKRSKKTKEVPAERHDDTVGDEGAELSLFASVLRSVLSSLPLERRRASGGRGAAAFRLSCSLSCRLVDALESTVTVLPTPTTGAAVKIRRSVGSRFLLALMYEGWCGPYRAATVRGGSWTAAAKGICDLVAVVGTASVEWTTVLGAVFKKCASATTTATEGLLTEGAFWWVQESSIPMGRYVACYIPSIMDQETRPRGRDNKNNDAAVQGDIISWRLYHRERVSSFLSYWGNGKDDDKKGDHYHLMNVMNRSAVILTLLGYALRDSSIFQTSPFPNETEMDPWWWWYWHSFLWLVWTACASLLAYCWSVDAAAVASYGEARQRMGRSLATGIPGACVALGYCDEAKTIQTSQSPRCPREEKSFWAALCDVAIRKHVEALTLPTSCWRRPKPTQNLRLAQLRHNLTILLARAGQGSAAAAASRRVREELHSLSSTRAARILRALVLDASGTLQHRDSETSAASGLARAAASHASAIRILQQENVERYHVAQHVAHKNLEDVVLAADVIRTYAKASGVDQVASASLSEDLGDVYREKASVSLRRNGFHAATKSVELYEEVLCAKSSVLTNESCSHSHLPWPAAVDEILVNCWSKKSPLPSDKANLLLDIARISQKLGATLKILPQNHEEEALVHLLQGLRIYRLLLPILSDKGETGECVTNKGHIAVGSYETALTLRDIGDLYQKRGQRKRASEMYSQALGLLEEEGGSWTCGTEENKDDKDEMIFLLQKNIADMQPKPSLERLKMKK